MYFVRYGTTFTRYLYPSGRLRSGGGTSRALFWEPICFRRHHTDGLPTDPPSAWSVLRSIEAFYRLVSKSRPSLAHLMAPVM
jgi:hypothetical protein